MMKTKILLTALFACFLLTATAKNTRKVEREFRKRQATCLAEQEHQQRSGVKHYRHLPKWCRTNGKNLNKQTAWK